MPAATRVLRRFLAKANDPWPQIAREIAELDKAAQEVLALKEPLSKTDLDTFQAYTWFTMECSSVFHKWVKGAFMPGEVPDQAALKRLIPRDADDLPTAKQKIRQHRDAIGDIMDKVAPARFQHRKIEIRNPQHCSVGIVSKTLGALDAVLDRFRQRKAEPLLLKGLTYLEVLVEGDNPTDSRAAGWYDTHTRGITLMARKIQAQAESNLYDFVLSTTAHELGHLIEDTYLSREAIAFWNSGWDEVETKEAEMDISYEERKRYFDAWGKHGWDVTSTFFALDRKSPFDSAKFKIWLVVSKIIDESRTLTPHGMKVVHMLVRDDSKVKEAERALHLHNSAAISVPKRFHPYLLETRQDIPESIAEAKRKIDIVTDYGRVNADEDFAETFRAWILSPNILTDNAKYRMQRTLSLSHLHGKPVMRLAAKQDLTQRYKRGLEAIKGPNPDPEPLVQLAEEIRVMLAARPEWLTALSTKKLAAVNFLYGAVQVVSRSAKDLNTEHRERVISQIRVSAEVWAKELRTLEIAMDAASADREIPHGKFTIVTLPGVTKAQLNATLKALDTASGLVQPKFPKVLYGKIYLTKHLKGSTAAWYAWEKDNISLDVTADWRFDAIYTIIHELGHRHDNKFLDKKNREKYWELSSKPQYETITYDRKMREQMGLEALAAVDAKIFGSAPKKLSDLLVEWLRSGHTDGDPKRLTTDFMNGKLTEEAFIEAIAGKKDATVQTRKYVHGPLAVSEYGKKDVRENYAEGFAHYVLGKPMPAELAAIIASEH